MDQKPPRTTDDRLDEILRYLQKFDHREKRRQFWRGVGGIIRLIPIILTVYFAWYFYQHGAEIMNDIMQKTINATTESYSERMQQSGDDLSDKLKELLNQ